MAMVRVGSINSMGSSEITYKELSIKEEINECPVCNKGIQTKPLVYTYGETKLNSTNHPTKFDTLGLICKCPSCNELIYGVYADMGYQDIDDIWTSNWQLIRIYPNSFEKEVFEPTINNISSNFSEIYNQAKQAESIGLKEICGGGYRKALEFLIKDYAKHLHPTKEDDIESKFLKKCIDEYITNPLIKSCATGATYLGNDETHYVRKWEDKDIKDLKSLIKLTALWINTEEMTKKYQTEMGI